ncbi:MAG: Fe-S cluster assembly protein IscX [Treponema sp.]|nr:Fe-S cluster assembly protein IscX [Treponema sp.]
MKDLTWNDTDEIARALWEKYPNIPAVALSNEEIREKVIALDNFNDTPHPRYDVYLASIQRKWIMAGHGEYAEESIKRAALRPEP